MRLFLALELDATTRSAVDAWMRQLVGRLGPRRSAEIKLVDPANLHLTMHFFGEVELLRVDALHAALDRPWPQPAFVLALGAAGTFPPKGSPRVVWIGVFDNRDAATALHRSVLMRLREAGFTDPPDPRGFSPHLTIGRVRATARPGIGRDLAAALTGIPAPEGRWTVDRLTLFESHLSPHGPRYDARARFPLAPHA